MLFPLQDSIIILLVQLGGGIPVGVVEAKKDDAVQNIAEVEVQTNRYANSTFKWIKGIYRIRFVYEATGELRPSRTTRPSM